MEAHSPHFKILAPLYPALVPYLNNETLRKANGFYLGFNENDSFRGINRRPDQRSNFENYQDIISICDQTKQFDIKLHLTLNEHYYNKKETDYISKNIIIWEKLFDYVIISDLVLLPLFKDSHIKKVASTGTHTFNTEAIRFLQDLGFSSIVLPRSVPAKAVREFCESFPHLEFEYFILNDFCPYVDGLCRTHHGSPFHPVCKNVRSDKPLPAYQIKGCRLCNIFDLSELENLTLKIAGRGHDPLEILSAISVLQEIRTQLSGIQNNDAYYSFVQSLLKNYTTIDCATQCKKDD